MKSEIRNRKNQRIVLVVENVVNPSGLVFVMHGLSGNKEEAHVQIFAQAFRERNFTVVTFDTTNTFGESDGDYADATVTNYLHDLEDVIAWSSTHSWYQEPFYLAGHSLGGMSTTLYAEKFPERVKGLAPISPVVSGKLSATTRSPQELKDWQSSGWHTRSSARGLIKKLKWQHMEDRMQYDLLPTAHRLTMPVLIIVGEQDQNTPPDHQRLLFTVIPGQKELHIIKGAPHTFVDSDHLAQIKQLFLQWIDAVENDSANP